MDRLLQNWRIKKALPYLTSEMRVLDIGCGQGELFNHIKKIESYVGLDPDLDKAVDNNKFHLIPGNFPQEFNANQKFDIIIMLAVL